MMLSRVWSPSKVDEESDHDSKKIRYNGSVFVGLRILTQLQQGDSNFIIKSSLKLSKPTFPINRIPPPSCTHQSCFLKTCLLCKKNLSPDKDVYMYRGDQGYCSEECRNRQIYVDDMKELEASAKKTLSSFGHCRTGCRCETRVLSDKFQHRCKPLSHPKDRVIFS
ncbi:unnamed protein product [Ilex paraguariensis]|uniref:FLZ-type domain-containing protein n=1 Tax=Ilex paraguariensis TaxID=185542 RepID=A0ABC8RRM8_9AQUA